MKRLMEKICQLKIKTSGESYDYHYPIFNISYFIILIFHF